MTDPVSRILACYPASFFRSLMEQMDAAFATALRLTHQHYAEPERANMLGQSRHACCEEGFRRAARDAGLNPVTPHTEPAGGRYSLVSAEGVHLIRSNVQVHCGPPRPTRFRSAWAALNSWLDPVQLDLLRTVRMPASDRLCGMLIVTSNKRHGDPSVPAFVGLGIPRADLSEWIALEPIHKLLGRHHDHETTTGTPREAAIQVRDQALPRLKKKSAED
jgi:hypothetical protein